MMDFSKKNVVPRVGHMEQLAAIKRYAFEDGKGRGMRAFEVVNGSGFDFTVYPDRGLDIGPARYNGLPPTPGFAEQVIYHDLPADADGYCSMRISNPKFGADVVLSFRKEELPYLVQWRMPGVGDYVMGLEPANCHAEDYNSMAKKGLLRHIEPGQVVETSVRLEIV